MSRDTHILKFITFLLVCLVFSGFLAVTQVEASKVCNGCGTPIKGAYFQTEGRYYHPDCFICFYCKRPIRGPYMAYKGRNYHNECYKQYIALRCAVCGEIIEGEYLQDYWGNSYHKRHKGTVPVCDFCQRFIVGELIKGMVWYPDGRSLCGICAPSAVKDQGTAELLLKKVAGYLEDVGVVIDVHMIKLHLAEKRKLAELSSDRAHEATGFVDYKVEKSLFGNKKKESIDVYILYGMPKAQAMKAMAHELMHVWIFLQGHLEVDKALSEGSCNFAAYLVLKKIGGEEAAFLEDAMLDDDNWIYGKGFRRVKRFVERNGLAEWLSLFKRGSREPLSFPPD